MDKLIVLGTGNAQSIRYYNTCFIIKTKQGNIMCDAGGGNGILRQLRDANIPWDSIHHLIITHAHSDHMTGALWVIRMISTAMNSGKYTGQLHIYCHQSIADGLTALCSLSLQGKMVKHIGEDILFHPLSTDCVYTLCGRSVRFFDILSTKKLQFGFVLPLEQGGKLCCLGDEPYNMACAEYVAGAEWLLCEAFCLWGEREKFKPYEKNHSTVMDACTLAQQLGIPNLVIWHTEDSHENRKALYTEEGRKYYSGHLFVPEDLELIPMMEKGSSPLRVIIAGNRHYSDYETLRAFADQILASCDSDINVLSGAATGADALGERYAAEKGYAVSRYPADWDQFGKAAGPIRNQKMAEHADMLIAFWDGQSRGTLSMIEEAKKAGLAVNVKRIPLQLSDDISS